jgi:metallo-beta-lactamase class B
VTPRLVGIAIVFATAVCAGVSARGDEPASWRERVAPFRIAGDTWYVGSRGLSVIAIRTGAGVIVIDAGLPGAENEILANLASIGIAPHDVKFLLTSHAHYDHVGGLAALHGHDGRGGQQRERGPLPPPMEAMQVKHLAFLCRLRG